MAEYKIQSETLTGIANQVRRLFNTEDAMTPEQMRANLSNVLSATELPNAETASFGDTVNTVEYGITSLGTVSASAQSGCTGMEYKANEAFAILGLRVYKRTAWSGSLYLWNENQEIVQQIDNLSLSAAGWVEGYFTQPVNVAIGEVFTVSSSFESSYTYKKVDGVGFNSKITFRYGRNNSTSSGFPGDTSTTKIYGVTDIIIGPIAAELPDEYQIARTTMDEIANEVKRITQQQAKMSPEQIITALEGVAVQTSE